MPPLSPQKLQLARERAKQLFRFLKAYSERRTPLKRTLDEHEWTLRLRDLPTHSSIVIGEVLLNSEASTQGESGSNGALLTVRRPKLNDAPLPPRILDDWLEKGWQDPFSEIRVRAELHVQQDGKTEVEAFSKDQRRVSALAQWRPHWEAWAAAERPARNAMKAFERLYQLYSRIQLESERVELMLGDGQLRWQRSRERIDHPVLLQRVQLEFDATVPELRLVDADRGPELYTALLDSSEDIAPQQLTLLRRDLEQRGYHPLEQEATSGFLTRVVQQLGPRGTLHKEPIAAPMGEDPVIERNPVLFLRQRVLGYADAFDRVLAELEAENAEIPSSLIRLVGIEPTLEPEGDVKQHSPWGEPPDVLLSKPANVEQIAIARALERHSAVQVQGPPGTGKSHTIANLIGHLVADGKRVLVTSHTTKALRVLRQHIVEPLRPLAVAVLENDLEGRTQMKEAVVQILSKLTESPERLAAEVDQLTAVRTEFNASIDEVTARLADARAAEYQPIVVGGTSYSPADAARLVHNKKEGGDWIPAPVSVAAPLSLTNAEIMDLYATNESLNSAEESELEGGLPSVSVIPNAQVFATLVAHASDPGEGEGCRYWSADPAEAQIESLNQLDKQLSGLVAELRRLSPWEREIVKAGHSGGTDVAMWQELAKQIRNSHALWDSTKPLLLEHGPEIPAEVQTGQLVATYEEILVHLSDGGSLGWLALVTRSTWKQTIAGSRVNDDSPTQAEHFQALKAEADLKESRRKLKARWLRQAEPAGMPAFDTMGSAPELPLLDYAARIETRLQVWKQWWPPIEQAMGSVGLSWHQVRGDAVAAAGPADPFQRDVNLLTTGLSPLVARRLAACRALRASRLLLDVKGRLTNFRGPIVSNLRRAIETRDVESYARAMSILEQLRDKVPLFERRQVALAKLQQVAPAWANAVKARQAPHGNGVAPGHADAAWTWRQLHAELERRAELDEQALGRKLEQLRTDLRRTTAQLIERKAWLAQVKRVGLKARQALQGWADTQARIGRGTGKRVPELQAQARRLLDEARDAVPVWIMPMSRVAESFQSSKQRFDVVIVDEASQSDVVGLLGWYLGERLLVVGDDEQVSPMDVGQTVDATTALIGQHLEGIPNAHLYDGRASIYNLAGQCFGGTIRLREHFRCMPSIIEFSNHLSYNGEIKPLRNPAGAQQPHVVEYVVSTALGGQRDGKRNQAEARMLVSLLKAMAEDPRYDGKTFGAISLLGDEQAEIIQTLALQLLGAVELASRRFAAGSPAQYQGDERDVVLLSMVDVPTGSPLRMRQEPSFKQRYNVAASRAKDQLWLVHSLDPARDLQDKDLRREFIAHVRDPEARLRKQRETQARAESPFEADVIRLLLAADYEVTPQVWVGNYRIDMVVSYDHNQVAIECDGDRYHGVEQIPADMARQAILERAGWRFVRIRGTRFYRDPDNTMKWVCGELDRLGIKPTTPVPESVPSAGIELREAIVRRAWEIMREQEWAPPISESMTAPSMEPQRVAWGPEPDSNLTLVGAVLVEPGKPLTEPEYRRLLASRLQDLILSQADAEAWWRAAQDELEELPMEFDPAPPAVPLDSGGHYLMCALMETKEGQELEWPQTPKELPLARESMEGSSSQALVTLLDVILGR